MTGARRKPISAITGDRLLYLLKRLDLSQRSAAFFLGKDERTIRKMVAGDLSIDPATAMLLEVMVKHHVEPERALRLIGVDVKEAWRIAEERGPTAVPRYFETL